MGRSSYSFQKRQKELARKQKKEEKRQRKLAKNNPDPAETPEDDTVLDDAVEASQLSHSRQLVAAPPKSRPGGAAGLVSEPEKR